jgi:phosphatidylglycerol---prolipoprotein diacylglyceryl transferase
MDIGINPVAFTIGSFGVRWYGIMIALGILVLIGWTLWQVKKGAKLTVDSVLTAALVGIPSGVIFSRLLHVIDNWEYFRTNFGAVIGGEGLTIYGAVLGAALGIWLYSKFTRQSFGYMADIMVPGILLAQAVGRVGCTLNGCCYGTETTSSLSIVYTNPNTLGPLGIPVYPTTIFEIVFLLLAFVGILPLRNRLKPDGSLFLVYLSLYSLWRLGIDYIRDGTPFFMGLHQAQFVALVVLAICVPMLVLKTRWVKKGELAAEPVPVETKN